MKHAFVHLYEKRICLKNFSITTWTGRKMNITENHKVLATNMSMPKSIWLSTKLADPPSVCYKASN